MCVTVVVGVDVAVEIVSMVFKIDFQFSPFGVAWQMPSCRTGGLCGNVVVQYAVFVVVVCVLCLFNIVALVVVNIVAAFGVLLLVAPIYARQVSKVLCHPYLGPDGRVLVNLSVAGIRERSAIRLAIGVHPIGRANNRRIECIDRLIRSRGFIVRAGCKEYD